MSFKQCNNGFSKKARRVENFGDNSIGCFSNSHFTKFYNRRQQLVIISSRVVSGKCGYPTTPKPCPTSCPNKRRPVCGTDDKTYRNGCYLARTKCSLPKNQKRQLRVKHKGTCGGRRKPKRCLSIRKCRHKKGGPVCGSDGKSYPSKCHLRVVKCNVKRRRNLSKIDVTLKHMGPCKNSV